MKFIKRLIILSGAEGRGSLSIERNGEYVVCRLCCFGKSVGGGVLVMLIDGERYSHNIHSDREEFSLGLKGELDVIHAAVICFDKAVMYGTNTAKRMTAAQIDSLKPKKRAEIYAPIIADTPQNDTEEEEEEEIFSRMPLYNDEAIASENYYPPQIQIEEQPKIKGEYTILPSNKCQEFLYNFRQSCISNCEKSQPIEPIRVEKTEVKTIKTAVKSDKIYVDAREGSFFERLGDDIEKLFETNEREKALEDVLPNSKWVKIEYNNSGKFYVIGLVGKEFLCYGVPADFTPLPPDELKGYCWWLPLKPQKPDGKGYWIMYQDLKTGEPLKP